MRDPEQLITSLMAALRKVEWVHTRPLMAHLPPVDGYCPACRRLKSQGHNIGCTTATALGRPMIGVDPHEFLQAD